jgi:hypothetical protein
MNKRGCRWLPLFLFAASDCVHFIPRNSTIHIPHSVIPRLDPYQPCPQSSSSRTWLKWGGLGLGYQFDPMIHTSNQHDHTLMVHYQGAQDRMRCSSSSVALGGALRVWPRQWTYCLSLFNYQTQSLQVLDRSAFSFFQSIFPFPAPQAGWFKNPHPLCDLSLLRLCSPWVVVSSR